MEKHGISWKDVLSYAPMANGGALRMVRTIKHEIKRPVEQNWGDLAEAMPRVLCSYRRRDRRDVNSPFRLLFGIKTRIMASDAVAFLGEGNPDRCLDYILREPSLSANVAEISCAPRKARGKSNGSKLEMRYW